MFCSGSRNTHNAITVQCRRIHGQSIQGLKGFWKRYLEPSVKHAKKVDGAEPVRNVDIRPIFPTTKLPQLSILNFTYTIEKQCDTILENSNSLFKVAYDREQNFRSKSVKEREQLPAIAIIQELDQMHTIFLRHDLHCALDYFSRMFRDDAMVIQNTLDIERNDIMQNTQQQQTIQNDQDELAKNACLLSIALTKGDEKFYSDYDGYLEFLVVQVEPAILALAKNINTMTTILSNTSFMVTETNDAALGLEVLDGLIDRWNYTELHRRRALATIEQGLEQSIRIRQKLLKKL